MGSKSNTAPRALERRRSARVAIPADVRLTCEVAAPGRPPFTRGQRVLDLSLGGMRIELSPFLRSLDPGTRIVVSFEHGGARIELSGTIRHAKRGLLEHPTGIEFDRDERYAASLPELERCLALLRDLTNSFRPRPRGGSARLAVRRIVRIG